MVYDSDTRETKKQGVIGIDFHSDNKLHYLVSKKNSNTDKL